MAIRTRAGLAVLVSLAIITALNCKSSQQNSNKSEQSNIKVGRWITQFRSPSLQGFPAELNPAEAIFYSSLSVVSPSVVFVAGDMKNPQDAEGRLPVFVRTTDGGTTWTEKIVQVPNMQLETLQGTFFSSQQVGWIIGRNTADEGVLLKTTDSGDSWSSMRIPFNQLPTTIFFIDANTGWMGGQGESLGEDYDEEGPSDILFTTDGGQSWKSQMRLPVSTYDIFFVNGDKGWAVGSLGTIYHTTDGGRNWTQQRSELELGSGPIDLAGEGVKRFKMRGVYFTDAEHGFVAAAGGTDTIGRLLTTSNGGVAWSKQWSVPDAILNDVFFLNPKVGWVLKNETKFIYLTVDGGSKWLSESKDWEMPIYRIAGADATHIWAVGGGGIFFRVTD